MPTGNISKVLKPDIAALDRSIALQSFTTSNSDYGEPMKTWATYATVKAHVNYAATGSGEDYAGHVNLASTRVEFTIRWKSGVSFKDRILFDSDYYDITRKEEIGRRRYLKLTADRKL